MKMFIIKSSMPIFPVDCESDVGSYKMQVQADEVLGINSFTIKELEAISRITDKQYIPYDDVEAHEVLRRIDSIIRETNDMARNSSQGTQ
jgi:hypothetical protein